MENINIISNGKYTIINKKITEGAYSKVYNVINNENIKDKYIVKIQKIVDRAEAVNEIKILHKIKKNKEKYVPKVQELLKQSNSYIKQSKIIDIEDYYNDNYYIYIIFKKYEYTLEEFNILYHQTFQEHLPLNLISKLINSLFLGLFELSVSKIIHCDVKSNNIMITSSNKKIHELFKLIKTKKIQKTELVNYIDILYIDFNLSQKYNTYCKSTRIQTLYYMAPEIILGNSNFTESIDLWSLGCIIFELLTGKYLFDIYNYNSSYGHNYSKYKVSDKSSELDDNLYSNKSSELDDNLYSNKSSYNDSSIYNNQEELILLHLYRDLFGDNSIIIGNKIQNYYNSINSKDKILIGSIYNKDLNSEQFIQYIKNNINIYNIDFQNIILEIFNKIFIYNFDKRLTVDEYLIKYYIIT